MHPPRDDGFTAFAEQQQQWNHSQLVALHQGIFDRRRGLLDDQLSEEEEDEDRIVSKVPPGSTAAGLVLEVGVGQCYRSPGSVPTTLPHNPEASERERNRQNETASLGWPRMVAR